MPAKTMEEIALLLQSVRFKRRLFGGVDEDDVWRIMEKLHKEYAAVMDAQQERMTALIDERDQYIAYLESNAPAQAPNEPPAREAYPQSEQAAGGQFAQTYPQPAQASPAYPTQAYPQPQQAANDQPAQASPAYPAQTSPAYSTQTSYAQLAGASQSTPSYDPPVRKQRLQPAQAIGGQPGGAHGQ